MRTFADWNHANQYLSESLIRVGGETAWVRNVDEKNQLWYYPPASDQRKSIRLDSKEVDFTPVPLGYVNLGDGYSASYTTRIPRRMWKVGLCPSNTSSSRTRVGSGLLCSENFAKCVKGVYPSLEEALKASVRWQTIVAFSRLFAIDYDKGLLYKDRRVGAIRDKRPVLDDKFLYLQEVLSGVTA